MASPVDAFIEQDADAIWLHQNEMWERLKPPNLIWSDSEMSREEIKLKKIERDSDDGDLPFKN